MAPAAGAAEGWAVPAIVTPVDLAEWLGLEPGELEWFADCQARERRGRAGVLRHYHYRWQPKRSGAPRLVEAPRPRLKAIQRRVLHAILDAIPPHEAAHGFRAGRSIATHAVPHVAQPVVVTLDLKEFFPSITFARVLAVFLTVGYPETVARRLAGLCTNSVPADVLSGPGGPAPGPESWRLRRLYTQPHLPQGAPTSPALANLAAYRLDARLSGLARALEAQYTRYADDLTFSGGDRLACCLERFVAHVGAIAIEEGFAVQHRKTRVMRPGVRQHVAGVVVNERPNVARDAFDRLKATLHNCVRDGPGAQNRAGHADFRAHLAGRVAHVMALNPARGARLRALFEQICW
jgi:retron-type reverse transcriptase